MILRSLLSILVVAMFVTGCNEYKNGAKTAQSQKAAAAANSIQFTENAEIDNIKRRLELTANPGLLGYIVLLNETGQPVMYTGVRGKITSGSKRLTEPDRYSSLGTNGFMRAAPSDEGTYGSSSEYIFFWTTADQYIQWNGKYLYSDKPFRLTTEPIVVALPPLKGQ